MDAEELEIQYSPSSQIGGDYQPYIDRYRVESAQARHLLPTRLGLAYGDQPSQTLDLYQAGEPGTMLHIFVHGGYWQELSSRDSAVMAKAITGRNIPFVTINYSLAPVARIDQMIDECYQAVSFVLREAKLLEIDPASISLSGHSAGAQLIWMMLCRYRSDPLFEAIKSVVLISGIYDLEPLCFTSINTPLGLTVESTSELSPMHNIAIPLIPCVVVVAEHDTREFRRQAKDFYNRLLAAEVPSCFIEVQGRNHFDIILDLETTNPTVLDAITESMN